MVLGLYEYMTAYLFIAYIRNSELSAVGLALRSVIFLLCCVNFKLCTLFVVSLIILVIANDRI